ncbi:IST1 FAMILY MEMBER [Salix koriyanagi]|uniref:IST1 FAMILY MEMBER n=1 Tax=Salix koriyanagi TaxID=2511006 RepID=A0A9Q0ZG48_9ROSI|nr:IST1 FAMILY MEMBER [Salix koriyanagi]
MTAISVATSHTKKFMKLTISIFCTRFNSSKCKTAAKMAVARIKLLRNKREAVMRQMRRDIALLLRSGQDATARIRVEHVIREQNVFAANEFIELFCELVVSRLSIIAKRRECPADLKEGIASLIFASPRCSEIPELVALRKIFEKKYGKDFVSAATDLRPNSGVNRLLIDKLSVRPPSGEVKLKVMKEIAKEHQIEWDTAESEKELLKAPEEIIEGPRTFASASSLPVRRAPFLSAEPNQPIAKSINEGETGNMHFEDTVSAAQAAAESAKQAIAAAQAAAYLANNGLNQASLVPGLDHKLNTSNINHGLGILSGNSTAPSMPHYSQINSQRMDHYSDGPGGTPYESQNFDRSHYPGNEGTRPIQTDSNHVYRRHSHIETMPKQMDGQNVSRRHSYNEARPTQMDGENISRRQSYNSSSAHSGIKFDESDCDEEIETEEPPAAGVYPPPERFPPPVPSSHVNLDSVARVHPKLPDYDELAARFEALKYRKS